jgi:prevent-host-death family protein
MRTVNIATLKAHLSAHIQRVREGEELVVCERNKPVARIIPCQKEDHPALETDLIARGLLTPPLRKRPSSSWPRPPGNISDEIARRIWQEERDGR